MKIHRGTPHGGVPVAQPLGAGSPPARSDARPARQSTVERAAGPAPVSLRPPALPGAPVNVARSAFLSPSFEAQLDLDTSSRSVAGNRVTPLFDGVASFAERNRLIDEAKDSISLQTFIFDSDDTGWDLARRLAARAREGVAVRVIYDALGSNRAAPGLFELMREAGVDVRSYGEKWEVWDLNDRWHEKQLIVDGAVSVLGGMNIADEYSLGGSGRQVFSRGDTASEPWRDVDVKLEGPAVLDATQAFLRNWQELGGTVTAAERERMLPATAPLSGGPSVRVVQSNPEVEGLVGTTNRLYLRAIETAERSITIESAYFLPPPELREALAAAARRGVSVQVMTNSRESTDMGFVAEAARYFYDDLLAAGVRIFEKQGGTLHSKSATFDGQYSIVGSVNLNGRSKYTDAEVAVGVQDEATARQLEARFAAGLAQTRPISAAELEGEAFHTNLKQWALSTLAWTF